MNPRLWDLEVKLAAAEESLKRLSEKLDTLEASQALLIETVNLLLKRLEEKP